ncbi:hypothetical protein HRR83_003720 [Exophiala dermatitidis]|uniref:Uncharacterized protein n=1 Tax=Exophiala dermatitidis TaxID=5970 RepID=A0AAN6IW56_EXODE|nr:hypothetical protein HRR74_002898 [Exophiala dermatitidis]KAJ4529639.1 hypothetical protein HRR73_000666 [Exophiala dermatitidis]KAJ4543197.1 hypothetical protein HRR77_005453 [Exophiala dermatitidis]KAJ4543696.1 hypothetical protein HRR76_001761 [Exophiala dermatitidis]KAJ4575161.1 hypothetical protein HRR79_002091 [Exophiala dermatitidis]
MNIPQHAISYIHITRSRSATAPHIPTETDRCKYSENPERHVSHQSIAIGMPCRQKSTMVVEIKFPMRDAEQLPDNHTYYTVRGCRDSAILSVSEVYGNRRSTRSMGRRRFKLLLTTSTTLYPCPTTIPCQFRPFFHLS